jgi:hypothetical protein
MFRWSRLPQTGLIGNRPAGNAVRPRCGRRTNSGRKFRGDALQQCVSRRGETPEGLKTCDFPIALPVA